MVLFVGESLGSKYHSTNYSSTQIGLLDKTVLSEHKVAKRYHRASPSECLKCWARSSKACWKASDLHCVCSACVQHAYFCKIVKAKYIRSRGCYRIAIRILDAYCCSRYTSTCRSRYPTKYRVWNATHRETVN